MYIGHQGAARGPKVHFRLGFALGFGTRKIGLQITQERRRAGVRYKYFKKKSERGSHSSFDNKFSAS